MQLTEEEWKLTRQLVNVLTWLRHGTKLVEGEKQPTISVTVPMLFFILNGLEGLKGASLLSFRPDPQTCPRLSNQFATLSSRE